MLFLAVTHNVITPDGKMITAVILCVFLTYAPLQNNKSQITITNTPSLISLRIKMKQAIETRKTNITQAQYCREIPSIDACAHKAHYKTLKNRFTRKPDSCIYADFLT